MKKRLFWLIAIMLCLGLLPACESDDDDEETTETTTEETVAGIWVGTGTYHQGTPVTQIVLNLVQNGNFISGSYSVDRTGRSTMTGSITGSLINGQLDLQMGLHGSLTATYQGNVMSASWHEDGFGGVGGTANCTLVKQ